MRELESPLYVAKWSDVRPEEVWLYIKPIQYADISRDFDDGMDKLIRALKGEKVEGGPQALQSKLTGMATLRLYLPYMFSTPLRGRDDELRRLRESLNGVVQVTGTGGIGKSRLAAEVALKHEYGAIWYRCTTGEIDLLSALIEHLRLPPETNERQALERLKARPKTLIVIDNVEDVPEGQRPLYHQWMAKLQAADAHIILTSRARWEELRPLKEITPATLSLPDAAQLAHDFASVNGVPLTSEGAESLAKAARNYPRLIEWAVGQLGRRPLKRVLEQLEQLKSRDLQDALYEMINRSLEQMSRDAGPVPKRLLRCLVVFQGTFNDEAIVALKPQDVEDADLDEALDTLQRWRFLRYEPATERYWVEEMVRLALPKPDEALFFRYADHYIRLAQCFDERPPEEWADLDAEAAHFLAIGDALTAPPHSAERDQRARAFADNIVAYLGNRREVRRPRWLERGLELARADGDPRREALFLNALGSEWSARGEGDKVLGYYEEALAIFIAVGAPHYEAAQRVKIAELLMRMGARREAAIAHVEQAIAIMERYSLPILPGGPTRAEVEAILRRLKGEAGEREFEELLGQLVTLYQ